MKGLVDTHTFIWWDSEPSRLSPAVLNFLENNSNTILLSVVSIWEILIKRQLGKLSLNTNIPLRTILAQQQTNGIQILPVTMEHVLNVENLPAIHKDPFDRLLIAQTNVEGAVLVSVDSVFTQYPVKVFW
jgi:PIN domain nuclease of toxin-antitoxin system